MVEIYNEELRDLLAPVNAKQKKQQSLQIKVQPNETSQISHKYIYLPTYMHAELTTDLRKLSAECQGTFSAPQCVESSSFNARFHPRCCQ